MIPANIHIKNCSSESVWCSVQRVPWSHAAPIGWTFPVSPSSVKHFPLKINPHLTSICISCHARGKNANPFITETFTSFFFTLIGVSHAGTRLREELPSTPECLWAKRNLSAPEGGVESQKARCVGFNVHRQTNVPGRNARVTWVQLFVWGRKWCF